MNDQAKRWTAYRNNVLLNDRGVAEAQYPMAAARLAACADLLRGVGDLSQVVIHTRGQIEEVRRLLYESLRLTGVDAFNMAACRVDEAMALLIKGKPVPPKGD